MSVHLQFREVFLTPDYLGIAMEYAAGGDMFQHVTNKRGLSEDEARWFFQQLILGLDYCHKMVSPVAWHGLPGLPAASLNSCMDLALTTSKPEEFPLPTMSKPLR